MLPVAPLPAHVLNSYTAETVGVKLYQIVRSTPISVQTASLTPYGVASMTSTAAVTTGSEPLGIAMARGQSSLDGSASGASLPVLPASPNARPATSKVPKTVIADNHERELFEEMSLPPGHQNSCR